MPLITGNKTLTANTARAVVRNIYNYGCVITVNLLNIGAANATYSIAISDSSQTAPATSEYVHLNRTIAGAGGVVELQGLLVNPGAYLVVSSNSSSVSAYCYGIGGDTVTYSNDVA